MSFVPPIIVSLRIPLLRCAGLLALGATISLSIDRFATVAAVAEAREVERQERLKNAADDAERSQAGDARYRDMFARGAVGPGRRRDWLEILSRIKEARQLTDIEYEFAPQQTAAIETVPTEAGRHEFMASAMKLRVSLPHEQDFLDLLDDIGKSPSALPRVRACKVERNADPDGTPEARLKANCTVDWITLREKP